MTKRTGSKRGLWLIAALVVLSGLMYGAIWWMGRAAKQHNVMGNVLEAEVGNILGPDAQVLHPPDDINKDNAQDIIGVVRTQLSDSLGQWVYFSQLAVVQVEKRKAYILLLIDPNGLQAAGKPLVPEPQPKAPHGYRLRLTRNAVTFTYDFEVQPVDSLGQPNGKTSAIVWDKQYQTYTLNPT